MNIDLVLAILFSCTIFIIFQYFKKFEVNTLNAIIINYFIAASLAFIVPFKLIDFNYIISQPWFGIAVLLGFLFVSLFQVMAYASQEIGVATTTIANKITFIFPTLLGIIFFNEDWNTTKIVGLCIAAIAVFFSAGKRVKLTKGNSYVLIAVLFLGGGILEMLLNFVQNKLLNPVDTNLFFGVLFLLAFMFGLFTKAIKKRTTAFSKKDIKWGVILGIPNYFSMFFLLESLKTVPSSNAFPIANMGVILGSTFLSFVLFGEKVNAQRATALVMAILAIILISKFSIIESYLR